MFGAMVQVAIQITQLTGCEVARAIKFYELVKYNLIQNGDINMYSYFCSNGCYNDFANKYIEQVIAIAPRREPLETPIENPEKTKHTTSWGHTYYDTRIREREV
jgi:hypothetical protein